MQNAVFIRCQIDPFKREAFKAYAAEWSQVIPRCGARLVRYFLPDDKTNDIARGLIGFDSLASDEQYRARLRESPQARARFKTIQGKRLFLREEHLFLEMVDGTGGS